MLQTVEESLDQKLVPLNEGIEKTYERGIEYTKLEQEISDLLEMLVDLHALVHETQPELDRLEDNICVAKEYVEKGFLI